MPGRQWESNPQPFEQLRPITIKTSASTETATAAYIMFTYFTGRSPIYFKTLAVYRTTSDIYIYIYIYIYICIYIYCNWQLNAFTFKWQHYINTVTSLHRVNVWQRYNNNAGVYILRRIHPDDNEPPCEQRRITFNDDGQRVQLARPELPAPHYIFHLHAATNYTHITV